MCCQDSYLELKGHMIRVHLVFGDHSYIRLGRMISRTLQLGHSFLLLVRTEHSSACSVILMVNQLVKWSALASWLIGWSTGQLNNWPTLNHIQQDHGVPKNHLDGSVLYLWSEAQFKSSQLKIGPSTCDLWDDRVSSKKLRSLMTWSWSRWWSWAIKHGWFSSSTHPAR